MSIQKTGMKKKKHWGARDLLREPVIHSLGHLASAHIRPE